MSLLFLNETVTNLIAISSVSGAVAIMVLAKFNYWCATTAKRQAKVATEQASVGLWAAQMARERADSAMESLEEMMRWAEVAQHLRRETASESLEVIARSSRTWILGLLKAYENGPASILPRKFDEVMVFMAIQTPAMAEEIYQFQRKASATEEALRAFMEKPLSSRTIAPRIAITLGQQLEQLAAEAESLSRNLKDAQMKVAQQGKVQEWQLGPYWASDAEPAESRPEGRTTADADLELK
jgi:hypothetical protein